MLDKFEVTYELNKIPDLYKFYFSYHKIKEMDHEQKRKSRLILHARHQEA